MHEADEGVAGQPVEQHQPEEDDDCDDETQDIGRGPLDLTGGTGLDDGGLAHRGGSVRTCAPVTSASIAICTAPLREETPSFR